MGKQDMTAMYNKRIEEIKRRISEIDGILDMDISDQVFDALQEEARKLTEELGKLEYLKDLYDVQEAKNINGWTANFLSGFNIGTQAISLKQLDVFKKINRKNPFSYNGKRYDFSLHFRGKGGLLFVKKL